MSQADSIITELLQDIDEKDKFIESLKGKEEMELLSYDFTALRRNQKVIITGIALAEGTWKGKFYDRKHIELSAGGLKGRLMDVEHLQHPAWGDTVIGKVTKDDWHPSLNALLYEAEITNDQMGQEVLAGLWKGVSVSIARNLYRTELGKVGVKDIKYVRLTLTKFPGCKTCQVTSITKEELANIPQLLKEEGQEIETGESSMTDENESTDQEPTSGPTGNDPAPKAETPNKDSAGIFPSIPKDDKSLKALASIINTNDDDAIKLESITKLLKSTGSISDADVRVMELQKEMELIKASLAQNKPNGEDATEGTEDQSTEETESTETEDTESTDKTTDESEDEDTETGESKDEDTTVTKDKTKEETEPEATETKTTEGTTTDEDESTEEKTPTLEQIIDTEGRTLDDDADTATRLMIEAIERGEW